jgi:membrane protease YdiL (CAAX protease family)
MKQSATIMRFSFFFNQERKLRSIWWVFIFFFLLALVLIPFLLLAESIGLEVSIWHQAAIVLIVSLACQWLKRDPMRNLLGAFDARWFREFLQGGLFGSALMILPAFFLMVFFGVRWHMGGADLSVVVSGILLFISVAVTEELLFRGFIFQQLISAVGQWPAQIIVGGLFLLTHIANPGMTGSTMLLAGTNIFLASIMFGLAYIRTGSLALPIGLHLMANWVQGDLLGFGVSGVGRKGILQPELENLPAWLTGSSFGLEASIPCLIGIVISIAILYKRRPAARIAAAH